MRTTPMRPAETNTRPRSGLPAGAWDTHFHVFEPGYPPIARPPYNFPDATLDQYLRVADVLGLDRMVLVQPSYYGTDNTLLTHVLGRLGPDRCRGVVQVEEDVSDADLDRYHRLGVRAIRLDLVARADWPAADLIGYIRRMSSRAAPRGWHVQLYLTGSETNALLPFLAGHPEPVVLDHMGMAPEPDRDRLLDVLRNGNCWVKLSGPYRFGNATALARALVAARPDRLIWGSDWPHLPDGQRDTGDLLSQFADWAPDEINRRRILAENPPHLFY